ncbi:NAD-dependent epimerase/dehydratase family protein, partial [Gluconobacter cerevisiae]|uniref:NAD-dependent epimerase/dehydratase family protein n=1 Tax=Gluconobacter cerevisiae TaxID=1379734 RepID=UPI0033203A1A
MEAGHRHRPDFIQSGQHPTIGRGTPGKIEHFLHCSTLWVYGHTTAVPAGEDEPLNPFGKYGIDKAEIEKWLMHEARITGFPATI